MPDDELCRAADAGTLRQPAVLAAQVRRMLAGPEARTRWSRTSAASGCSSALWNRYQPDRDKFPDFDDYLRISMRRETELFFENIVREDRSILDFLDAKYTFLNERLARYLRHPRRHRPRVPPRRSDGDAERGGVLTQASVLTVSSYATRTSPVLRGKWILENLLNAAAPAAARTCRTSTTRAVGTVGVAAAADGAASRRTRPARPATRGWTRSASGSRTSTPSATWRTKDGKLPIDASGTLPDGRDVQRSEGAEADPRWPTATPSPSA